MSKLCKHFQSGDDTHVSCSLHGDGPVPRCDGCHDFTLKSRGLGDTARKLFSAVGITEKRVKKYIGDCGCSKRRRRWNYLFPWGNK